MENSMTFDPKWRGKACVCDLTVCCGGDVLAVERLNITKAVDRKQFTADLLLKRPGLDSEELDNLLLKLAAERLKTAEGTDEDKQSVSDLLIEMASEAELFCDENQTGYATIQVDSHYETWPVRSRNFRLWLRGKLHEEHRKTAKSEAMATALETIETRALFDGDVRKVFVRLAEHDSAIFLDLADIGWRTVRIDCNGWKVINGKPPVRFIRPRGMLALPEPQRGGNISELHRFLNVANMSDFILLLSWLVACLRPRGPYPALCVYGEQGSAKSTACKILRGLIDPNSAPLRAEPRNVQDLAISAGNSWIVGFDNLSHLSGWLSDGLCRLSTGGGFCTRELYTGRDEEIFEATRPVIVNGIGDVVTRPDLLDRAINITFQTIPETERKSEAGLWDDFEQVKPLILGALLDAVSTGLRNLPQTCLKSLPRMADFALWSTACESGLRLPAGAFLAAYTQNRQAANATALESNIVAPLVIRFMEKSEYWQGTATELLEVLEGMADEKTKRRQGWPGSARGLSNQLRRIAPNLRVEHIEYKYGGHTETGNLIILERLSEKACTLSSASSGPSGILAFADETDEAECSDPAFSEV